MTMPRRYSPTLPRRISEATTELLVLAAACGGVIAACLAR